MTDGLFSKCAYKSKNLSYQYLSKTLTVSDCYQRRLIVIVKHPYSFGDSTADFTGVIRHV